MTSQIDPALELADLVAAIGFFELFVTTGRTGFCAGALGADRPQRMVGRPPDLPTPRVALAPAPKTCCSEHRLVQALRGDTQNVDALMRRRGGRKRRASERRKGLREGREAV